MAHTYAAASDEERHEELCHRVEAAVSEDAEPEPLRRPMPPAAPYPLAALGDILAPAAQRIHEVLGAPSALCGQSILAAASLAAQAHADALNDGRHEPLSLWCVSIAESGERKSGVDRIVLDAHRAHEREALTRYESERAAHDIDVLVHALATKDATAQRRDGKAGARDALEELGARPAEPINPMMLLATPTLEGLHVHYGRGQPSVGLFHDDGGEFLGGYSMRDEHRMQCAAGLSRLWDAGEFDRVRAKEDGARKYYGRRLAMHLMLQPVIAETSVLGDEILTRQGFLARCMVAWPDSTIGTRKYVEVNVSQEPAVLRYRDRMTALLRMEQPIRTGTRSELDPRALVLSPDAKTRWVALHNVVEAHMRDGGDYASVRAWASKAPAQALRIAGVLTLVDDPRAGVIEVDEIDRAAELMLYALGEAVRVVGTAAVPAEIRHAEALLAWCWNERIDLLHSGAALRLGPAAIRSNRAFTAAATELERCGWAKPIEGGREVDGKMRRRVWTIRGPR